MAETMLTTKAEQRIARPLAVLAPLIREDLKRGTEAAEAAGMPYYRAAGEKLLEAKAQLKHGEFLPWVERQGFPVAVRQLQIYMRLVETEKTSDRTFLSIGDVRRETQPSYQPRPSAQPWHAPVQKIVERVDTEVLNLKKDELKRAEEREAQRQLALQLIDIGYKVLAGKLHPDKGGSREAMARLNAVRDRLKGCA